MEVIRHYKHTINIGKFERWISLIGGGALAAAGLERRSISGVGMTLLGADLIRRGVTGRSYLYEALGMRTAPKGQGAATTSVPYELGIRVDRSITILKPREEVYRFWRTFENLPRVMEHLKSVSRIDEKRSHWVARGPLGRSLEWDAEINNEIENELIGWRSLEGSQVDNAGSVRFSEAPGGRGVEVRIELQYNPAGGVLGALLASLWGEEPSRQIARDLRRLKQVMELGEATVTAGQPTGRGGASALVAEAERRDTERRVLEASRESFPASDAPAWRA